MFPLHDLKIMTVRANRHRPAFVSAVDLDLACSKAPEGLSRRMAVAVVLPNANHSHLRLQGVEPGPGTAPGRAVMTHLEKLHTGDEADESRLRRPSDVSSEQGVEGSVAQVHDQRVLIRVQATVQPLTGRVENRQGHGIDNNRVTGSGRSPRRTGDVDGAQELEV